MKRIRNEFGNLFSKQSFIIISNLELSTDRDASEPHSAKGAYTPYSAHSAHIHTRCCFCNALTTCILLSRTQSKVATTVITV